MHKIIITAVAIGTGLAMDAFAVSVSNGMISKGTRTAHCLKTGFFFGFFQMIMPALGWLCSISFSGYMSGYAHWIAFLLLFFIGGKMLYESILCKNGEYTDKPIEDPFAFGVLAVLAIATSIDALLVGVSFAAADMPLLYVAIQAGIIGIITFFISFYGVKIGQRTGAKLKNKAGIFGGSILMIMGIKILLEGLHVLII